VSEIKRRKAAFAAPQIWILLFCFLAATPAVVARSYQDSLAELKQRAAALIKETRLTEAAPLLEKIVVAEPANPKNHLDLASALLALSTNAKTDAEAKQLRIRARAEYVKAKELGTDYTNIDAVINGIPVDGSPGSDFSKNATAEKVMEEAEAAFSRGNLDEAFKLYQKALAIDPKLYHAALFSGDVMLQKNELKEAEVWYERAIQIDPNKETAYRYSATPLMKQHKYEEALARYIEAYITEPYNRFTTGGLLQWAQVTQKVLAHPKIDIPTNITFDEKGNSKINIESGALGDKDDPSGAAWMIYGITRVTWHKEKFFKTYPDEKQYRHSLAEEADALRSVLAVATETKSSSSNKTELSPSLKMLKKLNDEGLLEAYILLARVDREIALDHPAYLKSNRDKLRRYVADYVAKGGGN